MKTSHGISVRDEIRRIANSPGRALAWEFFVFFARFEYALKRHERYLMNGNGDAQPNWDRFASDSDANFRPDASPELRAAVEFYLAQPPRKQLRQEGQLRWSEPQMWDGREPRLVWLLRVVRTVRNNLFHGGKFPLLPIAEPSRDLHLLENGLVILSSAITLQSEVSRHFLDGLE